MQSFVVRQKTGRPPPQTPAWQVSPVVQRWPVLQAVPFGFVA
jgi:hypothetical protein